MRRSHVPSRLSVARWRCQFWADCTTNISEREYPTGRAIQHVFESGAILVYLAEKTRARGPHRICAGPRRPSSLLLPNLVFSTHNHLAVTQIRGEKRIAVFEDENQLVVRAIESVLACICLGAYHEVFQFRVDLSASGQHSPSQTWRSHAP